jgi:hypothetical protein
MMNLRKVGIGKTSTFYLPLSNAMTRKTKWTYLLSLLFISPKIMTRRKS